MIKIYLLILLMLSSIHAHILSSKEKIFLKKNPTIILGSDKKWMPYVIQKNNGMIVGYDQDILDEVNKYTGANFILQLDDWSKVVEKAKNRNIDGLSTSMVHKERKKHFNFSAPYLSQNLHLLVKHGNPLNIQTESDLVDKTIVIQKGDMSQFKRSLSFPLSNIIYKDTTEEMLNEVIYGNADAIFGNGSILYIENKLGLPYLSKAFIIEKDSKYVFSIRKDWPEALSILNKGLAAIHPKVKDELYNKWFKKSSLSVSNLNLTAKEHEYIEKNNIVRVCADSSWGTFKNNSKLNEYPTFNTYFLDNLLSKIGMKHQLINTHTWEDSLKYIKEKKCDIISMVQKTKERSHFMNFTSPYGQYPLMIVTKNSTPYIYDLNIIQNKKIAIIKKHAAIKFLSNKYSYANLIYVKNEKEGMEKLKNGEVFAFIEVLPSLLTILSDEKSVKINRELNLGLSLSFGVQKENMLLFTILEKALEKTTEIEKNIILKKLVDTSTKEPLDYQLVIKVILLLVIIFLGILYWNLQLKKGIAKALLKNKEQESLLYFYSKQKSISDLVGNISHQWKEPLNELSSLLIYFETKIMLKQEITNEEIAQSSKKSRKIITFLSDTVDTFNNFYKVGQKHEYINLYDTISNTISMLYGSFEKNNIKINITCTEKKLSVVGSGNELKQVLLSLINNAQNVFIQRKISNPKIDIRLYSQKQLIMIDIEDNAGGIEREFLNKVFNMAITNSSQGTGIGLYLSKKIIEEKFEGTISVENKNNGAMFRMILTDKTIV